MDDGLLSGDAVKVSQCSLEAILTFQHTLAAPISFSGVGLHSGASVNLRILPAPAGHGIVFHRVDLENFPIEATVKNVAHVAYATTLMKQGVLISTIEHLLSSLYIFGVDNAIVELDNLEVPILDGSALEFVSEIQRVGLEEQSAPRTYLVIRSTKQSVGRAVELESRSEFVD